MIIFVRSRRFFALPSRYLMNILCIDRLTFLTETRRYFFVTLRSLSEFQRKPQMTFWHLLTSSSLLPVIFQASEKHKGASRFHAKCHILTLSNEEGFFIREKSSFAEKPSSYGIPTNKTNSFMEKTRDEMEE